MNTFIANSKGGPDNLKKSIIEGATRISGLKTVLGDRDIIKLAAHPFFFSSIDLKVSDIFDRRKLEQYERDFVEIFKEQDERTFFVLDRQIHA